MTTPKLPTRERCEEVLKQENHDTDQWTCPIEGCGKTGARAHFIAEHVLAHHREIDKLLNTEQPYRQIEVD